MAVRLFKALKHFFTGESRCLTHYREELSFRLTFMIAPKVISSECLKVVSKSFLSGSVHSTRVQGLDTQVQSRYSSKSKSVDSVQNPETRKADNWVEVRNHRQAWRSKTELNSQGKKK